MLTVRANEESVDHRSTFEAVDKHGRVRGRISFDNWRPLSAQVHVRCESAIALRRLLPVALDYGFRVKGLSAVIGAIPSTSKARELAKRLGFKLAHVVRDGWDKGEDLCFYELRPEWCAYTTRKAA